MNEDNSPRRTILFEVDPIDPIDKLVEELFNTYILFRKNDLNMPQLLWKLIKINTKLHQFLTGIMDMILVETGGVQNDEKPD
jgi:hypothetical protein